MQFKDSNGITFLQFDNITWFNSLNRILRHQRGASNSPIHLKVLAKLGLCSNGSQKLHRCSLVRARKISVSAHILVNPALLFFNGMVKTKSLKHRFLWLQSFFFSATCNCFAGAVCTIGKTHKAL